MWLLPTVVTILFLRMVWEGRNDLVQPVPEFEHIKTTKAGRALIALGAVLFMGNVVLASWLLWALFR